MAYSVILPSNSESRSILDSQKEIVSMAVKGLRDSRVEIGKWIGFSKNVDKHSFSRVIRHLQKMPLCS